VVIAGSPPLTFSTELFRSADYTTLLEQWEKVRVAKGRRSRWTNTTRNPVKSLDELWRVCARPVARRRLLPALKGSAR